MYVDSVKQKDLHDSVDTIISIITGGRFVPSTIYGCFSYMDVNPKLHSNSQKVTREQALESVSLVKSEFMDIFPPVSNVKYDGQKLVYQTNVGNKLYDVELFTLLDRCKGNHLELEYIEFCEYLLVDAEALLRIASSLKADLLQDKGEDWFL